MTLSGDDRLWLGLAAQLGLVTKDVIQQVLADDTADDAAGPVARRFMRRGLVSPEDVEVIAAVSARVSRVHGDPGQALAFLTTHAPAQTAPWLSMGATMKSGESPRPTDSLDGLDFVVPELEARYRDERGGELGRGGLGRVFAVRDQVMGREVAMKQLLPERSAAAAKDTRQSVTLEARFLREARLAAQMEHPSIVPVFEVGRRPDGSFYYTMRRIRGRTLADAVRGAKTSPERLRLVPAVLAVAQALAYAHSRSVIHRDVKPQNVMLGSFGETYLLDWGLARIKGKGGPGAGEVSMAPDITGGLMPGAVGTPSYMSPEQALGRVETMDERTDVWGLGALLYEVLTGRPPYVGDSAMQVIQQVVADAWTPVKALNPETPNDLVAVCTRALAKDPMQRYASAKEFSDDLEAWLHGRPVSARDYSGLDLVGRLLKRNPVASALVASLLVVLLAVGTWSWRRIEAQRNKAQQFVTFALSKLARDLYDVAGAEPLLEQLAQQTVQFLGDDSGLDLANRETRLAVAQAWYMLGQASVNAGRFEEASRYADDCTRLLSSSPARVDDVDTDAAHALRCLVLSEVVTALVAPGAAREARARAVEQFLEARASRWPDSQDWQAAMSYGLTRLHRAAVEAGTDERAQTFLDRALALDEARLGVRGVPTELIASLRDAELMAWKPTQPEAAFALGERALSLARMTPRRLQNGPLLRAWLGVLTQHIMLLKWSGRAADVPPLMQEGDRVADQLLSVDPERTMSLGVVGDFFIEVGRAKEATAVLLMPVERGARSDYLTSYLLAAFMAGDDAAVLARRAETEASKDAQAHLLLALALARSGQPSRAAALLRARASAIAESPMQWPRGWVVPVAAATAPPLGPALGAFSDAMEQALPGDDRPRLEAALRSLAAALDAMASAPPAQDARSPPQGPR